MCSHYDVDLFRIHLPNDLEMFIIKQSHGNKSAWFSWKIEIKDGGIQVWYSFDQFKSLLSLSQMEMLANWWLR